MVPRWKNGIPGAFPTIDIPAVEILNGKRTESAREMDHLEFARSGIGLVPSPLLGMSSARSHWPLCVFQ